MQGPTGPVNRLSGQPDRTPSRPGRPPSTLACVPPTDHDPTASLHLRVDRGSPVPLYHQLAQQLEAAVTSGALAPGTLLGNEIGLARRLGLSRPTVRQAIQSLVDAGLLVRRRGVGTQVLHAPLRRPLELSSLHDDLEAAGLRPTTRVLRCVTEAASPETAAALQLAEGAEVVRLERLRLSHGEPLARLTNHLPAGLLDLAHDRLAGSGLYGLLREAGITLHSAHQSVGARAATAEEAGLLGEAPGAPLLTMRRLSRDHTGRAVELGSHVYRATRHSFDFQLLARR